MEETKKEKRRGITNGVIILIIILAVVFMSQQPFLRPFGIFAYNWGAEKISSYWSKTTNWFWAGLYPNIQKEAVEKGGALKEEAITQKDNAAQSVWQKIKNYFANIFLKSFGTKVE